MTTVVVKFEWLQAIARVQLNENCRYDKHGYS